VFADGHAFLRSVLFFFRADCVITPALQTFSIFRFHIVRAFLARSVAQRTAGPAENGHGAKESDEDFHFEDSLSFDIQKSLSVLGTRLCAECAFD
jgi:hypothetical protein